MKPIDLSPVWWTGSRQSFAAARRLGAVADGFAGAGGRVEGDIEASDEAIIEIGDTGEVKGQIKGDSVLIYGTVEGDVSAVHKLELGSSARVTGRLSYSLLKLEPGAVFEGELEHQNSDRSEIPE